MVPWSEEALRTIRFQNCSLYLIGGRTCDIPTYCSCPSISRASLKAVEYQVYPRASGS
ncbi:hypothetical protein LINPERPRIM_LOCUS40593 [Linum perenne]